MIQRVFTYIDGFNLYYGLREKGWHRYHWLNLSELARNLLKQDQELIGVKYFTARITSGDRNTPTQVRLFLESRRRKQLIFLEALSTLDNLTIHEGQFLNRILECKKCGFQWSSPEEKMTDVNIATELLSDAFDDRFDVAQLISGDSDLAPPIKSLLHRYPGKSVIVAFPPCRYSDRLKNTATNYFYINEKAFRKSVFPDEIRKSDGYVLRRPTGWI